MDTMGTDDLTEAFARAFWVRVDAFLAEMHMSQSHFGRGAVGDSNLLFHLRTKRDLTLKTARKIEAFMREERMRRAADGGAEAA